MLHIAAHPDDEDGPTLTYLSRGLGAEVTMLSLTRGESGANLVTGATANLNQYTTILLGIRAYAVRDDVRTYNQRLLEYDNGGTLIVSTTRQSSTKTTGHFPIRWGAIRKRSVRKIRP